MATQILLLCLFFLSSIVTATTNLDTLVGGQTYAMKLPDDRHLALMAGYVCASKDENHFKSVRLLQDGDGNATIKLENSFILVFNYIHYWKVSSGGIQVGDRESAGSFQFKKASDSDSKIYSLYYSDPTPDSIVKIHANGTLCTNCNGTEAQITSLTETQDWSTPIVAGQPYAMELPDGHKPDLKNGYVLASKEYMDFKSVRFMQDGDGNAIIKLEKSFILVFDYFDYWKVSSNWIQVTNKSADAGSFKFKKASDSDSDIYSLYYSDRTSDSIVKIHADGKLCTNCNGTDAQIWLLTKRQF